MSSEMSNEMSNEMSSDPWFWRAVFADGSMLDEYDADAPEGHGWAAVIVQAAERATHLTHVLLIPQRPHLASQVVIVSAETTACVFRRRALTLDSGTGVEVGERPDAITCVALTRGDMTAYTFLFADGSVVISDDLNAV